MLRVVCFATAASIIALSSPALSQPKSSIEADASLGAPNSPQQQFNAATAKFDAREWRSAAEAYFRVRTLLPRSSAGASVAAIRQGHALSRLGEYRPATDAVEAGLAALPNTQQYQTDRLLARQTLATAYELTWEYLLAAENYRLVTEFSNAGEESVKSAWLGLARTAAFDDPQLAYEAGRKHWQCRAIS